MDTVCKNSACCEVFKPIRASALYCSTRCRVAAYRTARRLRRDARATTWRGPLESFSSKARNNVKLSDEELADRRVELAEQADGGEARPAAVTITSPCLMA